MNALRPLTMALWLVGSLHAQTAREEADAAYDQFVEMHLKWAREEPDFFRRFLKSRTFEEVTTNVASLSPAMNEARLLSLRMLQDYPASGGKKLAEESLRKDLRLLEKLSWRVTLEISGDGRTNFYTESSEGMRQRGFTNVTEEDIRDDPMLVLATSARLHASLPRSCLKWPPPDTNRMAGVTNFIAQHGWNMGKPEPFGLIGGAGTEPLTGLPWPVIGDRTFRAYTVTNWLVVLIQPPASFAWSHGGLLWSTQTIQPSQVPFLEHYETKALGGGWYGFWYQN